LSFRTNRKTRKPYRVVTEEEIIEGARQWREQPIGEGIWSRIVNPNFDFEFRQWQEQRRIRQSHKNPTPEDEAFLKLTFAEWREGMQKRGLL
jgi:hypothetical protein